jgi:hypothetical protein
VIFQRAGAKLRAAASWEDARTWLEMLRPVRGMFMGATLLLLLSGLYMTRESWGFATPWVVVGMLIVVLFPLTGALVVGRRLAGIGLASIGRQGPLAPEERARIHDPALWSSIFGMNGGALGVVWLMTNKPGWGQSIGVPLFLTLLGVILGAASVRSARARAVERTPPRTLPQRPLTLGGPGAS